MLIWAKRKINKGLKSVLTRLGGSEVVKFFSPEEKVVLGRDASSRLGLNFDGIGDMDRIRIGFDQYSFIIGCLFQEDFFLEPTADHQGVMVSIRPGEYMPHDVCCKIPGQELTQLYSIKRKVQTGRFSGVPFYSSKPTKKRTKSAHVIEGADKGDRSIARQP